MCEGPNTKIDLGANLDQSNVFLCTASLGSFNLAECRGCTAKLI